jgi:hypothetical protein
MAYRQLATAASPEHEELARLQREIAQLERDTGTVLSPPAPSRTPAVATAALSAEASLAAPAAEGADPSDQANEHSEADDRDADVSLEKLIDQQPFSAIIDHIKRFDRDMPLSRASRLTGELVTIAEKSPRDVVSCIKLMQDGESSARFQLFRKLDRQPVLSPCGNWQLLGKQIDLSLGYAVGASVDGTSDAPWPEFLGEGFRVTNYIESEKCERQVLVLGGFAAMPPEGSPYTRMFRALEHLPEQRLNALTSTDLMAITTEFKWNAYARRLLVLKLVKYLLHFLLAGSAMITSTQSTEPSAVLQVAPWDLPAADILVLSLLVTNSDMFHRELNSMRLDGARQYCSNVWNLCDVTGILALYVACAAHLGLVGDESTVESVGATGLLLNSFSILPLLMPFRMTGLLVRTFFSMGTNPDINGFFIVTLVLLYGFSVAFTVSMPHSETFYSPGHGGPLVSFLTTFEAMIGAFHLSNYDGETLAFFLLFLFVSRLSLTRPMTTQPASQPACLPACLLMAVCVSLCVCR